LVFDWNAAAWAHLVSLCLLPPLAPACLFARKIWSAQPIYARSFAQQIQMYALAVQRLMTHLTFVFPCERKSMAQNMIILTRNMHNNKMRYDLLPVLPS
jgi:hypothetical protein